MMVAVGGSARRFGAVLLAGALGAALAAAPAAAQQRPAQRPAQTPPAQQQAPAATPPTAAEPLAPRQITGTTQGWTKICQRIENSEREGCLIAEEVRAENGAFLASLAVQEVQSENRRQVIIIVPLGMALQAGMLFRVDQQSATPGKYGTCLQQGCLASMDLTAEALQQMRTGQNVYVTVRNAQGIALDLTLPLATFARAYDGPATDARALEEQQRRLEQELSRRAEETRQRLQQQQPPAPAPAR